MKRHIFVIVTACIAMLAAPAAMALPPAIYSSSSRLASGNWVKVKVTGAEGMRQITYDQLRQWGFSNPANVRVYGYGSTALSSGAFSTSMPDDLNPTPSIHTADGRLIFYADGAARTVLTSELRQPLGYTVCRNYYSDNGYYFLADYKVGGSSQPDAAYVPNQLGMATSTHICVETYEPEVQNPGEGGTTFHDVVRRPGTSFTLPVPVRNFAGKTLKDGIVSVTMAARMPTSYGTYTPILGLDMNLNPTLNAYPQIVSQASKVMLYSQSTGSVFFGASYDTDPLQNGVYDMTVTLPESKNVDYLALDRMVTVYPRYNKMDGMAQLIMQIPHSDPGENLMVLDATPSTQVWNITNPANVYRHRGVYDEENSTFTVTFDASYAAAGPAGCGRMIAFDADASHPGVEFVEKTKNQNIHGAKTPSMLVITTDELLPYAQQIADEHRLHDGMDVLVYTQTQVFNEFSSGVPTVHAYRRMAKMFADRQPGRLQHMLLFGAASWDPRGIQLNLADEHLLTFQVEPAVCGNYPVRHSTLNFASDAVIGMLADNFTLENCYRTNADIAVGRIPVLNAREAQDVTPKVLSYIANPPSVNNYTRALMISDDGDQNRHLDQSVEITGIFNNYQPAMSFIQAHNSIYPRGGGDAPEARRVVQNALTAGLGYFSFTGHGRPDYFTAEHIWTRGYAKASTNAVHPLAMFATCDTYLIDRPGTGLAETMVMQPVGGAIAAIAAGRSVYLDYNQYMNIAVAYKYATASGATAVGDIYRQAQNYARTMNTGEITDLYLNTMCYNLCGDPAIHMAAPSRKAVVNRINGSTYTTGTHTIRPMNTLQLSGTVNMPGGDTDSNFNGSATITIYDAPHSVPVIKLDKNDRDENITLDEHILASVSVPVVNGTWEMSTLIPYPTFVDDNAVNRVIVVATSDHENPKDRIYAAGRFNGLQLVDDTPADLPDVTPLQIADFYIDHESYAAGNAVPSNFTVCANLALGDAGLNVSSSIGAGARLVMDGRTNVPGVGSAIEILPDNTASLSIPITDVAHGHHSLVLSVADNAGNRVERALVFMVDNAEATALLSAPISTARTEIVFDGTTSLGADATMRLLIRDHHGNTVFTTDRATLPFEWDLRNSDGTPVPDGRYTATLLARNGTDTAASQPVEFVVVR